MLPKLGQQPASPGGFAEWLLAGSYQPNALSAANQLELRRVQASAFVPFINFDYERFALASRESFTVAFMEASQYNLAGWPLLKLYYSGFFAAHAIMRSRGAGVAKLDKRHAKHLSDTLQVYDPTAGAIPSGMYLFKRIHPPTGSRGELSVVLQPSPQGTGVHESFWLLFCEFMDEEAASAVVRRLPDAASFLAGTTELTTAIRYDSTSNAVFLSSVRNDINYQHKHLTWFPIPRRSGAINSLGTEGFGPSASVRLDLSKQKDPLGAFSHVSRFLSFLNTEVGDYVAERSTRGGAFGQKWRRLSALV